MERSLMHLEVGRPGPGATARVMGALRAALDGAGPAVAPRAGEVRAPLRAVPDAAALVVTTSGSTGPPRLVLLGREALLASALATHERLGGPGRWVLALPLGHVAGLQVLVRSVVAGTEPVTVASGSFDPWRFASAVEEAASTASGRVLTSLVPTQLHRIVAAAAQGSLPDGLLPLLRLDAVLVGGAATAEVTLQRARDLGLAVVTTYGTTETSGGCVYDGVPLAGTRLAVRDGVVHLGGATLALGYADGDDTAFSTDEAGVRWFRTSDVGHLDDGRLMVTGRADDVVVSGGEKVSPAAVEAVLAAVPGVQQVCVVGVADDEWGQVLVAVVVPSDRAAATAPTLEHLRSAVARTLWSAAAPRHLVLVDALAERGPGKVDRAATAQQAAAALARRAAPTTT